MVLTGIAAVALLFVSYESLQSLYSQISTTLCWMLSIGQVAMFAVVGFLLAPGDLVVRSSGASELVVSYPLRSRIIGLALGIAAGLLYATVLFRVALPLNQGTLWVCTLLIGLALAASASRLMPLFVLTRLPLTRCAHLAADAAGWLGRALLWVMVAVVAIPEHIAGALATPLRMFLPERMNRPQDGPPAPSVSGDLPFPEPVRAKAQSSRN
jgi:hypothetical protein